MDFGAHLRQAREGKGISLRDVAAETKISMGALEALERNDVARLPGGIFTRAFVRSYAEHVGLDPEQALKQFLAQYPDEGAAASLEPHGTSSETEALSGLGGNRLAVWLLLLAVPVAAVLVFFAAAGPWFGRDTSAASAPAAAPVLPLSPEAPPPPAPSAEQAPASVPVEMPTVPPAPAEQTGVPAESVTADVMTVAIAPVGTCWVSATVDGERRSGRVMAAGEREVIRVRDELVMDIGDAGAFAFSVNGTPARSLGGPGQVVKVRINRANYKSYLTGG